MNKKPKNNRKKWRYGLILSGLLACSTLVYGFDMPDDPNMGGFDMNIGEGTGEIPKNWEDPENNDEESSLGEANVPDVGNFVQDFGTDGDRMEEDQPKEQQWEEEIFGDESAVTVQIDDSIPTVAVSAAPTPTPTPEPTATLNPVITKIPAAKTKNTENTSEKASDIPKEPAKKKQKRLKESEPLIRVEATEDQLLLRIDTSEPFQILSFRINGKECKWFWKGKKIAAEFLDEKERPQKAELLGFVKSGRLYHETVDLTEKQ